MDLDKILDNIVEDCRREYPEVSEFEAAFMAVRLNLTVLTQSLAQAGLRDDGLDAQSLYGVCNGLLQTCTWMAAKEMAASTLRELDEEM